MKYVKMLYSNKERILFMTKEEIKKQYTGTALGITWVFAKPLVFMLSFWFFFIKGIRYAPPVGGHSFLLHIFSAYMAWFLISGLITSSSRIINKNKSLVKSIRFPLLILPFINVLEKLIIHILIMLLVFVIFIIYGGLDYAPDIYYINFIYYWFVIICFFTSLGILLSALNAVTNDIGKLINSIMQPLFWVTPILYSPALGSKFDLTMRLVNPLYYFIVGYKETMLYENFFWESPLYNLYIWIIIIFLYFTGLFFWKRTRGIIVDML